MIEEIWKPIPDTFGSFHWREAQVSNLGRVRYWWTSKDMRRRDGRYRYYKPHINHGSLCVYDEANPHVRVKTLVMETFVGPRPEGCEITHLDGNIENCRLDNLAYSPIEEAIPLVRKHISAERRQFIRDRWESIKRNRLKVSAEKFAREEGISVSSLYRILRESQLDI